jgi:hypothetical protein
MWYHYLLVLAGLYLVGSAIYNVVTGSRTMTSLIMDAVQIAIGGGIGYYGYTGIMTPAYTTMLPAAIAPAMNTMVGGIRKLFRK